MSKAILDDSFGEAPRPSELDLSNEDSIRRYLKTGVRICCMGQTIFFGVCLQAH
jgi:hypothetical protein